MPGTYGEMGESAQNAFLRPVVAEIDGEMSRLAREAPKDATAGLGALLESWAELVELLALGPAPEMRECPVCKHRGLRAATRCGFCWAALPHARGGHAAAPPFDGG